MKTNLRNIGITSLLILSTLLMGCGSKEPLSKKSLERKAENYAKGPVKIGKFSEEEEYGLPVNILTATDKEYGFKFEVKSEVRTVKGFDGTSFYNIFTNEPMLQRLESSTFHVQFMTNFEELYEDDLEDIEDDNGVEITIYKSGGYKPSNYIMSVSDCKDEDQCEDIFDEIVDCLKDYDTRGYFEQSEKDYNFKFGICFTDSDNQKIEGIDLEPSKW